MATPILDDYPIKINSTAIPFSGSMEEKYDTIESVNMSEAGTDIVQTERLDKLTLSIKYKILSSWVETFESWAFNNSYKTVSIFDLVTGAYKDRQMRMRNYRKSLVKNSEKLSVTTGIWEVSFDLIEK